MAQNEVAAVLSDPLASELLHSAIPARLAYAGLDGTPRAVPIWFHWDGRQLVLATPGSSGKVRAIAKNPKVALTIDGDSWPYRILQVRGTASVETVEGMVPEYALSAARYFGPEQGEAWVARLAGFVKQMTRVAVTPEWARLTDVQRMLPMPVPRAS